VRNIVGQEGAGSLFRGLTPSLFGSAVSWGLYFYFYEIAKGQHRERQVCPPRPPNNRSTHPPTCPPAAPELTAATALIEPPS
jgi:solute carrier family 25 folate transporter 32